MVGDGRLGWALPPSPERKNTPPLRLGASEYGHESLHDPLHETDDEGDGPAAFAVDRRPAVEGMRGDERREAGQGLGLGLAPVDIVVIGREPKMVVAVWTGLLGFDRVREFAPAVASDTPVLEPVSRAVRAGALGIVRLAADLKGVAGPVAEAVGLVVGLARTEAGRVDAREIPAVFRQRRLAHGRKGQGRSPSLMGAARRPNHQTSSTGW